MKYSLTFLMLGSLISYLGARHGGWWHLLHWFSLTCFALSVGYAGLGPRVFGKRSDGRIPFWIKVLHFPYMLYSEGVWQLTRLLSHEHPMDTVSGDLVIGRRLRARELPDSISNYVDLTSEFEDPEEIRQSTNYIAFPILDASVPTIAALHSTIARLKPGTTFVHCAQGHGRTGLFVLAILAHRRLINSFDEGMAILTCARPGVRLNRCQRQFITAYIAEQSVPHSPMP